MPASRPAGRGARPGPKRTKKIADAWEEQKAIKEVMVFLSGVGVSTSLAVRDLQDRWPRPARLACPVQSACLLQIS